MAASYPSSVRSFSTKRNTLDIIDAADPNGVQEEIVAIQTVIGVSPNLSTAPSSSGTFSATATTFSTLTARLANIETGIVADTHTQYLKRSGNEVVTNANAANVAFTITGASAQSANLQNWKASGGAIVASVSRDGQITASSVNAPEIEGLIIDGIFG
jgi:uncharacterized membrane protein YkgB